VATGNNASVHSDAPPAAGETIGERLKRLRLERGLSQRELAAPGVSYAYISRIEAGTRQPSVKALRRLAAKLGVSADYLETGSDLDPAAARELRLSDLELAIRLGEMDGAEAALEAALREADSAGDRAAGIRARVALAQIALENGGEQRAVTLLEEALADEVFAPVDRFDIYANLGRAYAGTGRPDRAAALYEQCLEGVSEAGGDPSLEARYAALLSYALTDMGEIAKAEEVVRHALSRVGDSSDPYMRVRLYWSIARLAHTQGREAVALENVRKAIALLQATDDTFHLARAHVLAAEIMLGRSDPAAAERHLEQAEQLFGGGRTPDDTMEITQLRSRLELLRGNGTAAIAFAREALALCNESQLMEQGISAHALADALALTGEAREASATYKLAVDRLEQTGQWRFASAAARSWGRLLREQGQESEALDVLDRAAELGMRATPEGIRAER
jgi:transcriptional regulator with XRE-family HTH domain